MLQSKKKDRLLRHIISILRAKFTLLGILYFLCFSLSNIGERLYAQSPMEFGKWAKISFDSSGLYVLDAKDLQSLGLSSIDKVCVWGYGGALMPEITEEVKERKLVQIPTMLREGKLYFYVDGLRVWDYNAEDDFFHHRVNHYANRAYLLLSEANSESPLRMQTETVELSQEEKNTDSQTYIQTILKDYVVDAVMPSGRRLYTYPFSFYKSLKANYKLANPQNFRMKLSYMAYPKEGSEGLNFYLNGKMFMQSSISSEEVYRDNLALSYGFMGIDKEVFSQKDIKLNPNQKNFDVEVKAQGQSKSLRIDYFEFNIEDRIEKLDGQLFLRRSPKSKGNTGIYAHYSIPNDKDLCVFALDREHYFGANQTKLLTYKNRGGESIELNLKTKTSRSVPRNYLALKLSAAYRPKLIGAEPNQNILGDKRSIDLLIICPDGLREEAVLLQKHYEAQAYAVALWTEREVFNAFNGGTPDAMAYRLLCRHYYENFKAENKSKTPFGLLLLGDAAYDNRKLSAQWVKEDVQKIDFLLGYQSLNSIGLASYTSDDFFVVLEDKGLSPNYKGRDAELSSINFERDFIPDLAQGLMSVSVGRLPVRSREEAKDVINKIISYDKDKQVGLWKLKACFVADNGDSNSHTEQSIEIVERFEKLAPMFKLNKIYLSSYNREIVGGKTFTPKAREDLHEALRKGTLLINYNGHGSPSSWAKERILTLNDIKNFSYKHLPLWLTATCDFSPFDALHTSAGEELLLNPHSGGIALLSTTRTVWDIPNKILNKAIIEELFSMQRDGSYLTLGEALRLNFVLLGSPLQQLPIPKNSVVINKVNDKALKENEIIKLHTLDKLNLSGYIKQGTGIDGNFQGNIDIFVYDAEEEIETIDNFNETGTSVSPIKYKDFVNILYSSTVEVKDGQFNFEFVVPKDVAYTGKKGKIILYAYDIKRQHDCQGYIRNLIIEAGSSEDNSDKKAPQIIEMKLSNKDIKPNMLVPERSEFYVLLKEETGLNLSNAGLGHQMRLNIDGAKGQSIDLTPYYSNSFKDKSLGVIKLILPKLSDGKHSAELRICDVYNNVRIERFDFIVRSGLAPNVEELKISMAKEGYLIVKHDQAGMPLIADVEVFDLAGHLLLRKENLYFSPLSAYAAYSLESLGLSAIKRLPTETYILRLSLKSKTQKAAIGSKSIKFFKP